MYTPIIILVLFAVHFLSAYNVDHIEDESLTRRPQDNPKFTEAGRSFTNGHGYQFFETELNDAQIESEQNENDKFVIKTDNDYYDENGNHDDTDEHGDINEVDLNEVVRRKRQRHYQPLEYTKTPTSPVLRNANGNIMYDGMNTGHPAGTHLGYIPRTYGMHLKNDQGYNWNHVNNMQNEPSFNQNVETIQQRAVESNTIIDNPYKTKLNDAELRNINQIPDSIPEIKDSSHLNHTSIIEPPYKMSIENKIINQNVTQRIEADTARNNVNQINKRIYNIKDKVKDRFANMNGILTSPEARTFLTLGKNLNISDSNPLISNVTNPNPKNLTLSNEEIGVKLNKPIATNDIDDSIIIESDYEYNNANSSLSDVYTNVDEVINEQMEQEVKNKTNNNTIAVNQYTNETLTTHTAVHNILKSSANQTTDILTILNSTTPEKVINVEDKTTFVPIAIDSVNDINSTTEIQTSEIIEKIEKTETETSDIKLTIEVNNTKEENYNQEEHVLPSCDSENDSKSEDFNFDELYNKEEFWDWLSSWTTAYMEILNENIKLLVRDEVAKQLEVGLVT